MPLITLEKLWKKFDDLVVGMEVHLRRRATLSGYCEIYRSATASTRNLTKRWMSSMKLSSVRNGCPKVRLNGESKKPP
jgi:hypothetical protein